MTKGLLRACARGLLKVLAATVMVAAQCIVVTPGIRGQAQSPPSIDIPSLAGKSMGDIIKTLGKPRYCLEFEVEKMKSRIPPGTPHFDDACQFRIGSNLLFVYSWRGRAVAFYHSFGNLRKRSTKPEDALRSLGIDVRDAKPSQILKDPSERPFMKMQNSAIGDRLQHSQDIIWSGDFSEKKWKELRVTQNEDDKRCPIVTAILDYKAQ
jgi:hypothetical protein